ncbi:LysR substrate-binding domain-containing protein [Mesonia sp.]|uniref:LysR substrate-binding domain-containing protein n=2 Tax=Mesonia sp. TaxID=1960830 RepID=UPI003F9E5C82
MDFRLRVFNEVVKTLSFSQASKNLYLSQPAVSKHIKELEMKYEVKLFERQKNTIKITSAGQDLFFYAEKILNLYHEAENHFLALQEKLPKKVKIGASTTIAQYIVPPSLAELKKSFPGTEFSLVNDNSTQIERKIEQHELSFALIEGSNHNPLLTYEKFLDDELVLVTATRNNLAASISLNDLLQFPLVIREEGSGTRSILENRLAKAGIRKKDLNIDMILGSTESIKSYLYATPSYAFVSIFSVLEDLKHQQFQIIDIEDFEIKRPLYFVSLQGERSLFFDQIKQFFYLTHNKRL